jgi:hypothetical protein
MNPIASFDIRGKRLRIMRDPCPENPLDTTDAPFNLDTYNSKYTFWHGHETYISDELIDELTAAPFGRGTGYIAIFFGSDGDECEYAKAAGALYVDREVWQAYAGAPATLETLRAQLAELRAYWCGDVFGYSLVRTFHRAGDVYETADVIDWCYGFYGAAGVASMADRLESPTFKRAVRRLAKTL